MGTTLLRYSPDELSAMQYDGELGAVGALVVAVDRIETSRMRADSYAHILHPAHIVAGRSAAWIHGVGAEPAVLELVTTRSRRADPVRGRDCTVQQLSIHRTRETVAVGDVRVLTPIRTALSLLSRTDFTDADAGCVRALGYTPAQILHERARVLSRCARVPHNLAATFR